MVLSPQQKGSDAMTPIDFKKYQQEARKTRNIASEHNMTYSTLGLAGEAGELANKVKKILRGDANRDELIEGIKGEMGDVLWYLSALSDDLGVELGDIAEQNLEKLRSRYERGKILGGGDNR
jgi:NTP pyrophosphatase (non-canonical NTP hydrolase)